MFIVKIKFLVQPSSAFVSDCKNLSFSLENLDINKSYKVILENGTLQTKIHLKSVDCGVVHKDILFVNSATRVNGIIDLNFNSADDFAVVSLYANIYENIEQEYALTDIAVFSLQIKSKLAINNSNKVSVFPSIVNADERANVSVKAKPHSKIQFSINSKRFVVSTNYEGEGSISLRGIDVLGRDKMDRETVQKFAISYATADDNYTQFFDSGSYINFVPNTMRTLQATNIENEPECAIIDKAPVNGIFVKNLDNFCDPHSFVGEYSVFKTNTFFSNKIGYCSQQLEIAPADSFENCRIYNSTSVSYLDNGIGLSVFASQQNDKTLKTLASRIFLNVVPSSFDNLGSKTYVGTIVKPYASSHKIFVSKIGRAHV